MKFGKKLQDQLEHTPPSWRPNFLSYKQLKKSLRQLEGAPIVSAKSLRQLEGAPVALVFSAILEESEFPPLDVDRLSDGERAPERSGKRASPVPEDMLQEPKKRKMAEKAELSDKRDDTGATETDAIARRVGRQIVEDTNFLRLVRNELHKFNAFFMEKEEEYLIRLDVLEERAKKVRETCSRTDGVFDSLTYQELIHVCKLIVTLHGEMVLLMNYSSLNFIGLFKILKKHDRRTGAKLRQSVLASVLQQPVFSTVHLEQLVERSLKCEKSLRSLHPSRTDGHAVLPVDAPPIVSLESGPIPRQVDAALRTMQDIRRV